MKIVVMTTGTNNTAVLYEPLRRLGHDLTVIVYDAMTHAEHARLPSLVAAADPAWVLYVGAIEHHHGKPVPSADTLGQIGATHLLVHLCCDGAEFHWWPQLNRYYDVGRFALQVNIDGVRTGPIGERGLTMLCPIDGNAYAARPWSTRTTELGFAGNAHRGAREATLADLGARNMIVHRTRDDAGPEGYREFLLSCRCVWNHSTTGGGAGRHVKARVLEAALAGCLVLEDEGSPLADWLEPNVDYLTYRNTDDVAVRLHEVRAEPSKFEAVAQATRAKVLAEHSPAAFWAQVLGRLGLGPVTPVREPPFRHWSITAPPASHVPRLISSHEGVNVVSYNGGAYLVPQALGPLDLALDDHRGRAGVQAFGTLAEAETAVARG